MRIHKEKNKRIFFNDEEVYFEKFRPVRLNPPYQLAIR